MTEHDRMDARYTAFRLRSFALMVERGEFQQELDDAGSGLVVRDPADLAERLRRMAEGMAQ